MTFPCVPPTQLALEIQPEVQAQAWQQSQTFSQFSRWYAYLNQMSLDTLLPWIQADLDSTATVWQATATIPQIWNLVNGTAIDTSNKRLIVIPDKSLETREFVVPQEWLDLPGWAGDYYLAVQVDPAGEWLRIWGYTTHAHLKTRGTYDPVDRTYSLDASNLIQDLTALTVVYQLNPTEMTRTAIAPASDLSGSQVDQLLHQLTHQEPAHWRTALPFEQWGALLEQATWRQRLLQPVPVAASGEISGEQAIVVPSPINLRQWLQDVFEDTWQAIESFLGPQPTPAFNFRRVQGQEDTETVTRRARLIRLQSADQSHTFLLILSLASEADGRVVARVQLYPLERDAFLPANLTLTMLSSAGDIVQSVQAREQDDCIQLKRFRCLPGKSFSIQISLGNAHFTEMFVS